VDKEESSDQLPSVDCCIQVHAEFHGSLHTPFTTIDTKALHRPTKIYQNDTGDLTKLEQNKKTRKITNYATC